MNTEQLRNLMSQKWTRRDGSVDQHMVDHCLKSSLYIQVGENFIDCGSAKPPIDSTLWYDDETDGPGSTFEAFRSYNLRSNGPTTLSKRLEGRRVAVIASNYYTGPEELKALTTAYHADDLRDEQRLATPEELEAIDAKLTEAAADYNKRLVTYWKRYSSKVHASGYFANR